MYRNSLGLPVAALVAAFLGFFTLAAELGWLHVAHAPAAGPVVDGTIAPERALSASAKLIIDHLRLIAGVNEEMLTVVTEREVSGSRLSSELAETPVEALDLSVRVFNSLKRTGITTVGDVLELLDKGESAVMSIRNFGEKSLDELRDKMKEKGFLKDEGSSE